MIERVLGLLLLPLLTRRLTEAEYGIWTQAAVVSSVLMPLVLVCLPTGIVRYFSAGLDATQRHRWMRRSIGIALGMWGLLALLAWCWPGAASTAAFGTATQARFVAVACVVLAADALFELLIACLRGSFRMRSIAAWMVVRGGTRFGLLLLALGPLEMPFGAAFELLASVQLALVTLAVTAELFRRTPAPSVPPDGSENSQVTWRTMLGFTAPLVLMSVLSSAHSYTDRFVLTQQLGVEATAVYAVVVAVVSVTNVAYTVLGFTLFPVLSRLWSQGDRQRAVTLAAYVIRVFLFIALPFIFWLVCMSDRLFPLLATQAYRVPLEVPLMLGVAAVGLGLYQIVLYILLLAGEGSRAAGFMLLAAVLNVGLNLLLVPRFGLDGAAAAAAISSLALAIMAHASSVRCSSLQFPWAASLRTALGALLAVAVVQLVEPWLPAAGWRQLALSLALVAVVHAAIDLSTGRSLLRAHIWRPAR